MKNNKLITSIIGALIGFANGFFGSGGGSILVPVLKYYNKIDTKKAHATAVAVILPLCIVSSFFYIKSGNLDYKMLMYVAIGGIAGGILGAKVLCKLSSSWLSRLFGIVLIITAIRGLLK